MMTMIEISCSECNTHLLKLPSNTKSIGCQVIQAGFIYKLPILFGGKEPLYFCKEDCRQKYYTEHYTLEQREKAKRITDSLKADRDDMVNSTISAIRTFTEKLKTK